MLFHGLGSDEGAVFGSLITNASGSSKKEGTCNEMKTYFLLFTIHVY